ncbi:hypothetical protein AAG906_001131 [Vitis piasezkii]
MQKDEDEYFVNYILLRCMLHVLKLSDVFLKAWWLFMYFFSSRVQPLGSGFSIFQNIFIVDVRPIEAVTYMQRNDLKMCLRSTNSATDASKVANVRLPSSSSFIIRMDEYNQWLSMNSS